MKASRFPPPAVLAERYPAARVWLEGGVPLVQALALVRAGLLSPADLAEMSREQFLSLPGVARKTLGHCERILGRSVPPSPRESLDIDLERDAQVVLTARQWRALGISTVAAKALSARKLTLQQLRTMSACRLRSIRGIGLGTQERVRDLLGPDCLPDD